MSVKRTRRKRSSAPVRGLSAHLKKTGQGIASFFRKAGRSIASFFRLLGRGLSACGRGIRRARYPLLLLVFIGVLSGAVLATRAAASALAARGLVPSDAAKLPSEKYTDSTAYFPKAVKTAEGGQLVVYPSLDPMGATVKTLLEYAHLADAACGGRFPVLFEDPALAVVLPRVFANGSFASAVIVNTRIEEQAPVRLRLRGFGSDAALWYPLWSGSPVRLPVVREAKTGDALVTLPAVGAWSGGFLVPETLSLRCQ